MLLWEIILGGLTCGQAIWIRVHIIWICADFLEYSRAVLPTCGLPFFLPCSLLVEEMAPLASNMCVPGHHINLELSDIVATKMTALSASTKQDFVPLEFASFLIFHGGEGEVGVDYCSIASLEQASMKPSTRVVSLSPLDDTGS